MPVNATQAAIMENDKLKQKEWIVEQFRELITSEPE
jgi:hypothetical protein